MNTIYYKILVCILFTIYEVNVYAQNTQSDTVFFLIDKTMEGYEYHTPHKNSDRFHILIQCKYYTADLNASFSFIELIPNQYNMNISVEKTKWRIDKKQLKNYQLIDMKWVAKQENFDVIHNALYKNGYDTYYYILFKNELDCIKGDSVLLHQVHVRHSDIDIE
ncbi:hypothetical protein ACT3CE_04275 [Marinifilum sp. RC60d5]|uniref:hypothetical protein n=1 Tax=Marinifilum sp. RC60d5 TaxID=3458414 RepID=UPI004036E838